MNKHLENFEIVPSLIYISTIQQGICTHHYEKIWFLEKDFFWFYQFNNSTGKFFDLLTKIFLIILIQYINREIIHIQLSSKIQLRILSRDDHFENFELLTYIIYISTIQQGICTHHYEKIWFLEKDFFWFSQFNISTGKTHICSSALKSN